MKTWPELYKMDSKGKIREWNISVCDIGEGPSYEVQHGLVNGRKVSSFTNVKEGKNIGRANETTAWEQCVSEAESLWTKQRDRKGYSESIPTSVPHRPMLAQSYDKHAKKIVFPCYVQNKLDGIRCLGTKNSMMSRQGKLFKSLEHIQKELDLLLTVKGTVATHGITLDGELYVHGEEFQELCSAIKRDKPSDKSHLIEYHVYDIITDKDYEIRQALLEQLLGNHTGQIKLVRSYTVNNKDEVDDCWTKATKKGYEGVMLRNFSGPYKINGRSYDLQKYKKFHDDEFEIVGAFQNKGKQALECTIECVTKSGKVFGVKPEGTEQIRQGYWKDYQAGKLKGKMLTVRYFGLTSSSDPVPRFPIGVNVRDYE